MIRKEFDPIVERKMTAYLASAKSGILDFTRKIQLVQLSIGFPRIRRAYLLLWIVFACKLVIGLVSAFDIYLTIKYVESLPMMELNPVGRWMMKLDSGPESHLDRIAGFIAAKFSGNFVALAVIECLTGWRIWISVVVAICVALAQLFLFGYLLFGDISREL